MLTDSQNAVLLPDPRQDAQEQGIDLLALVASFFIEWRLALRTFVVVLVLGTILVFLLQSRYVATATILPAQGHDQTDSVAALFSPHSPGTVFTGLLKSRSVANDIIDRAHLLALYRTRSYADARTKLADQSSFEIGADSILTITVKDRDAHNAAMIGNAYLAALDDLNLAMAQDQSRQVQTFFVQQLDQEKADLFQAEDRLEQTQKQTGLVQPETQTQIGLNAIATVRAQIVNLRVQLASVLQSETEENPQVERLRSQIAQLQAQESTMETGGTSPVGAAPPAGKLPQNSLDILRAQRDVKYHDTLLNSLSNQYEMARLSEDLSRPNFQVIDRAVVPERKSWPPRKLFVLVVFVFAILAGVFAVIVKLLIRRILDDPAQVESLQAIRAAFARR
jgi:tyrosine-protein kinase Etk/Wzc